MIGSGLFLEGRRRRLMLLLGGADGRRKLKDCWEVEVVAAFVSVGVAIRWRCLWLQWLG